MHRILAGALCAALLPVAVACGGTSEGTAEAGQGGSTKLTLVAYSTPREVYAQLTLISSISNFYPRRSRAVKREGSLSADCAPAENGERPLVYLVRPVAAATRPLRRLSSMEPARIVPATRMSGTQMS